MDNKILDHDRIIAIVNQGQDYATEKFITSLNRMVDSLHKEVPDILIKNELKILTDRAIALYVIMNNNSID